MGMQLNGVAGLGRARIRGMAALVFVLLVAASVPSLASTSGIPKQVAPAASAPLAGADGQQRLQDAVASVVVVALTEQFDGKPISVGIDSYEVRVSGARERVVSGRGRVDIEGAQDPITFNYRTLYDVLSSDAGYPTISIAGVGGGSERSAPNDSTLVGELDRRVAAALSQELGGRQVWLQLDAIESYESADRYVRIQATGLADLGIDGNTPARVEALYDRSEGAWLRVNYELGGTAAGALSMLGR